MNYLPHLTTHQTGSTLLLALSMFIQSCLEPKLKFPYTQDILMEISNTMDSVSNEQLMTWKHTLDTLQTNTRQEVELVFILKSTIDNRLREKENKQ